LKAVRFSKGRAGGRGASTKARASTKPRVPGLAHARVR